MKNISVIILAAGQGTRMKSSKPKVLHELCGKTMIAHAISAALEISDNVIAVLGHEAKLVESELEKSFSKQFGNELVCALQDTLNLPGTAGAVMVALKDRKSVV